MGSSSLSTNHLQHGGGKLTQNPWAKWQNQVFGLFQKAKRVGADLTSGGMIFQKAGAKCSSPALCQSECLDQWGPMSLSPGTRGGGQSHCGEMVPQVAWTLPHRGWKVITNTSNFLDYLAEPEIWLLLDHFSLKYLKNKLSYFHSLNESLQLAIRFLLQLKIYDYNKFLELVSDIGSANCTK